MSRAPTSSSPGDLEKPTNSVFVPPPVQRLSQSFSGLPPPPKSLSPSDPAPSLPPPPPPPPPPSAPSPLPGPNRAPTTESIPTQSCRSKPSNIFPRLHRLEIADDMACSTHKKPPLLELRLSSSSFLDAVATDIDSDKPLYAVETVGSTSTVWRPDPWDGSAKIADIRWPKDLPLKGKSRDHTQGATIQMDGLRWKESTSLLKYTGLGSSRKFHIPHHPHALKWKREGNTYVCTSVSCKGAVATLESFTDDDTAPKLKVFETLGTSHPSVPQLDHAGISLFLLDHLFVTALLLVTEPDHWMTLARNPSSIDGPSADVPPSLKSTLPPGASARQWRKIMYGEPMYPSLKTSPFDKSSPNHGEDADILDTSDPPQLSTSARQWRKIVYGEPLYPSLRPQSLEACDLPPRPSTATSFSSESAYSPAPSSAPSPGFYGPPSPFDDTDRTTLRSGTDTRQTDSPLAPSSGTLSPMPSSECIPLSSFPSTAPRRELPSPPSSYQPPPSFQPWLHRSRSSPRLSHTTRSPISSADDPDDPSHQSLLSRISTGWSVRQLPTPPLRESPVHSPQTSQTSQTQPRPVESRRLSQSHQRSLPPTPAALERSASEQHHGYSQSLVVTSRTQPVSTAIRSFSPQPGPSQNEVRRQRRQRSEKDPDEVINWMRNTTRAHRRRVLDGDDEYPMSGPYDPTYDPPPPAYNAIDFSTPPQARSPPEEGTHS